MTEKLLQFIWQHQHYAMNDLQTTCGLTVQIIDPGKINYHQGPDFSEAILKIGEQVWAGNIEIHVLATQWNEHGHSGDEKYMNVILHVVWREDEKLQLPFPAVELHSRVSRILLSKYERLMQSPQFIACQDNIGDVPELTIECWKQRLLAERLQSKADHIINLLQQNKYHWEETFWWLLASGFGMKVNSDSFLKIAQSIPFNLLIKHKFQLQQLEALLLGQAGILDTLFEESYPTMLSKEYQYLKKKYGLGKIHYPLYYLRMRPANFPTIRLAQLAALIHKSDHFFSFCLEAQSCEQIIKVLEVQANDYWHYHYLPDVPVDFKIKHLGKDMISNILINTIIPAVYAYGIHQNRISLTQKAIQWLEFLPAENNTIIRQFNAVNVGSRTSGDSQALIQLKNEYCNHKRCLECAVGYKLLNP